MISFITPVLNGEKFIEKCILSISNIDLPYEHIIIDGGSIDKTIEIISKYKNVKLISLQNDLGMYHAIHVGISNSQFNIISYINCDDEIISKNFAFVCHNMNKHNLDFVYADGLTFNEFGEKKFHSRLFPKILLSCGIMPFIQCSTLFTKNIYFKVGGFDYIKYKIAGDLDFFIKVFLCRDVKIKYFNLLISKFYKHKDSLGEKNQELSKREKAQMNFSKNIFKYNFARFLYHFF